MKPFRSHKYGPAISRVYGRGRGVRTMREDRGRCRQEKMEWNNKEYEEKKIKELFTLLQNC
jgi:hypothetical protein